ncbi:hypothetical protein ACQ4LE_002868 [Meloidogyne hapla]
MKSFLLNGSMKQTISTIIMMFAIAIVLVGQINKAEGEDKEGVGFENQTDFLLSNTTINETTPAINISSTTSPTNNDSISSNIENKIKVYYKTSVEFPLLITGLIISAILYICYSVCCFACSK